MNTKIEKITAEIDKLRGKISSMQSRLRDLERQKTELENADIIAAVRGVDIAPDELAAFMRMFKEKQSGILPDLEVKTETTANKDDKNKEVEQIDE